MKLPPYYQNLMDKAHKYMKSGEPLSFVGMSGCGKNYLFRLLVADEQKETPPITKIAVELTSVHGDLDQTLKAISLGLSMVTKIEGPLASLEQLLEVLQKLTRKETVFLICSIEYQEPLNEEFLRALYKWRNLLGFRLGWIICANYGITQLTFRNTLEFEKVITLRLTPILPLDKESARDVLETNQERYGKISEEEINKIIKLSGGNPGLMKSLLFLTLQDSTEKWNEDEKTLSRLRRLVGELPDEDVAVLRALAENKNPTVPQHLTIFGYINESNKIFSPIVAEYIQNLYQKKIKETTCRDFEVELTLSERKIFTMLKTNSGKIVTRDEIANTHWGDNWQERYSDWAIDQLIHAIRKKLTQDNKMGKIKTKKGEGFVFNPF